MRWLKFRILQQDRWLLGAFSISLAILVVVLVPAFRAYWAVSKDKTLVHAAALQTPHLATLAIPAKFRPHLSVFHERGLALSLYEPEAPGAFVDLHGVEVVLHSVGDFPFGALRQGQRLAAFYGWQLSEVREGASDLPLGQCVVRDYSRPFEYRPVFPGRRATDAAPFALELKLGPGRYSLAIQANSLSERGQASVSNSHAAGESAVFPVPRLLGADASIVHHLSLSGESLAIELKPIAPLKSMLIHRVEICRE